MRGERLSHTTTTISKHTSAPVITAVPAQPSATKKRALSDPFSRVPLYGCAYRGAIDLAVHIKDAAILGHAPKSCTWYAINGFTSYGRRGLYERGILYPAFVPRQFENTDITINEAVYGGVEQTRRKAFQMVKRGIRNIITVTSCIPGMSGDDLVPLQKELKSLGVDMYIIHTDEIEAGDYNEGMALCYKTLALQAVDPNVKPEPDCINLVYEHTISSQTDRTFMNLQEIFKRIGIRINCRFICAESMENIHNFLKAPYSIMARYDKLGHELQKIFEEKYGCRFLCNELPRGFSQTASWLRKIGKLYEKEKETEQVILENRIQYTQTINNLKLLYKGKKVILFLKNNSIDWILELAHDLDLDVLDSILIGSKEDSVADWKHQFSADWENAQNTLFTSIAKQKPDLIILNDFMGQTFILDEICTVNLARDISTGFFTGTDCAAKWIRLFENTLEGRWKNDKSLFEKRCP